MVFNTEAVTGSQQNRVIQKTRSTLLFLIRVQLVLYILGLIIQSFILIISDRNNAEQYNVAIGDIIGAFILLIYFFIFYRMVIKSIRLAILIFAWLSAIELIVVLIAIIILPMATFQVFGDETVLDIAWIIGIAIEYILGILTMVFAFRLAKFLREQQFSPNV